MTRQSANDEAFRELVRAWLTAFECDDVAGVADHLRGLRGIKRASFKLEVTP